LIDTRLIDLFRRGANGHRRPTATDRGDSRAALDRPTFSEYFNGDTARPGASHQTGWTALVAHLICRRR